MRFVRSRRETLPTGMAHGGTSSEGGLHLVRYLLGPDVAFRWLAGVNECLDPVNSLHVGAPMGAGEQEGAHALAVLCIHFGCSSMVIKTISANRGMGEGGPSWPPLVAC